MQAARTKILARPEWCIQQIPVRASPAPPTTWCIGSFDLPFLDSIVLSRHLWHNALVPLRRFPMCDTALEIEGRDLTDETLKSPQKPGKIGRGNLVVIRIEVRLAQKTLKVDGKPGRTMDSGRYANGKWARQKLQVKCVSKLTKVYSFNSLSPIVLTSAARMLTNI